MAFCCSFFARRTGVRFARDNWWTSKALQKAFAAKGIGIAAVSYDSPQILADFAGRRSITYPLLSDPSLVAYRCLWHS